MFLEIHNLKKSYGDGESRTEVLRGIDFSVAKGEICVLLGPSGSGKSTLLNIIGGIDDADEGYISIEGEKTADMNEKTLTKYRRKHLGYVFQMYNLIPNLNVKENVEVHQAIANILPGRGVPVLYLDDDRQIALNADTLDIEGTRGIEVGKKMITYSKDQIEKEEKYNLTLGHVSSSDDDFYHFFSPLDGVVTNHFDETTRHYGVDLVAKQNSNVLSVLDGVVIFTDWTIKTGYVIQVQHNGNLVSVYKHNSVLLKKQGDFVRAGEAIAVVGNTGEETTGPHLHFELWQAGKALNPETFIKFK